MWVFSLPPFSEGFQMFVQPRRQEEVVLVDLAELIEVAEERNEPWPELEEPSFTSTPPDGPNLTERIMWTMVGLLGAVTIYGVTKGDKEILMTVLAVAASALLGIAGLTPRKRRGEERNDPRAKRTPKGHKPS
jgi:hypothetical protein